MCRSESRPLVLPTLARFNSFVEELTADASLSELVATHETYRFAEGKWYRALGQEVLDPALHQLLTTTRSRADVHRLRNQRTAWLPIKDIDAVVGATFLNIPRKSKQAKFSSVVRKCLKHSNDAFDAKHDLLTGLVNKAELVNRLCSLLAPIPKLQETSVEATAAKQIAIYTIDVDHFKQINDTYGHIYGDLVLKALALRLERIVADVQRTRQTEAAIVSRPGGEEFTVVVVGALDQDDLNGIASQLCKAAGDEVLPNDSEWHLFKDFRPADLQFPHASERKVTISIGFSSSLNSIEITKVREQANQVLQEADIALYRAKAGGRNTFRCYNDILSKHGSVIEHHLDTDVVSIDIGSRVGTQLGQDFWVFHPDFCGSKAFFHNDGRTKKKIGLYPRYPYGRVEVFNTQPEISFCKVIQRPAAGAFPPNCQLEAIPVGSISHLLKSQSFADPSEHRSVGDVAELQKAITKIISEGQQPAAFVFSLKNISSIKSQRGSAFINHVLAVLYEIAEAQFPSGSTLGVIEGTKVGIVLADCLHPKADAIVKKAIAGSEAKLGPHLTVSCGIFCSGLPSTIDPNEKDSVELSSSGALVFALYASSLAEKLTNPIDFFTPATAINVLSQSRSTKKFDAGLVDYRQLIELGVTHSGVDNQAALLAFEKAPRSVDLAIEFGLTAVARNPTIPTYYANLGLYYYIAGKHAEAFETFVKLREFPDYKLSSIYISAVAHSHYLAYREGREQTTRDEVLELLKTAKALPEQSRLGVPRGTIERSYFHVEFNL